MVCFGVHCDLDWSIWVVFGLFQRGHMGGVFSGFWGIGWRFLDELGAVTWMTGLASTEGSLVFRGIWDGLFLWGISLEFCAVLHAAGVAASRARAGLRWFCILIRRYRLSVWFYNGLIQ